MPPNLSALPLARIQQTLLPADEFPPAGLLPHPNRLHKQIGLLIDVSSQGRAAQKQWPRGKEWRFDLRPGPARTIENFRAGLARILPLSTTATLRARSPWWPGSPQLKAN